MFAGGSVCAARRCKSFLQRMVTKNTDCKPSYDVSPRLSCVWLDIKNGSFHGSFV